MNSSSAKSSRGFSLLTFLALCAVAGAAFAFFFKKKTTDTHQRADEKLEQTPATGWNLETNAERIAERDVDSRVTPGVDPISESREPH